MHNEKLWTSGAIFAFLAADDLHKKIRAFEAIKIFVSFKKPIPDILISYLNDACDYYINSPGNAVSNQSTESNWSSRIFDIEVLRQCDYTVEDACSAIVARDGNTYQKSSLTSKRKGQHPSKNLERIEGFMSDMFNQGYSLDDIEKSILSHSRPNKISNK